MPEGGIKLCFGLGSKVVCFENSFAFWGNGFGLTLFSITPFRGKIE